jgi:putative nucleotidyltransferase with HDIG domain
MDRQTALETVKSNIKNQNLIKHMIATEAIMRALAKRFGEDEDEWGIAGLLHDIDLDIVGDDMTTHGKVSAEMAEKAGANTAMVHAILCHNEMLGIKRENNFDKALYCADPLTGLITAAALVRPEKKLAFVEVKSVAKRFKEKSFAAGANREQIASCSELGLELNEFIELGLKAMQGVSEDMGL